MMRNNQVLTVSGGVLAVFFLCGTAWAAGGDWRPTYDMVMRWVNFIILVALLVKFLKTPLKDFLKSQSELTSREIALAEAEKKDMEKRIAETRRMLRESESRLKSIRERIVRQGEARKLEIIENARRQSRTMMAEARRRIDSQMLQARARIRAELVDTAVARAMERLPGVINEQDNERFVAQFIEGTRNG